MSSQQSFYATAIAIAVDEDGPLFGVIILGESGAGKSSLALSAIESCPYRRAAMVADDAVLLEEESGRLIACAPAATSGMIEIRGHGPAAIRHVAAVRLRLAVTVGAPVRRMPEEGAYSPISEAAIVPLYPFLWDGAEATAAYRLRIVARSVLGGQIARSAHDTRPAAAYPPCEGSQ